MMKLSLEIPPSDYSTIVNSHNSPPSPPALPPPSSYSPLASPTLSGSWSVNKSQAELTSLLKEAYNVIKEKERDLTLAAEIGKSLLENNIALKSKYEALVVQLQSLQRQRQKATTFALQHASEKSSGIPIAPPTNSLDPFAEEFGDYYESDSESINGGGWSSSYDNNNYLSSSPDALIKKRPHNNNNNNNHQLAYKEIELIKELETRNQDLQTRLDEVIKEYEETDKINNSKIRKLETDVKHYKESYSQATLRIEDLEIETKRLIEKQKSDFRQLRSDKKSTSENEEFLETLISKVEELEEQNHHIERQKAETERKLNRITNELDLLQEECNRLIDDSRNYEVLQMQNRQQTELINELSESLEYERSKVVSLRSGMMYSRPSSRFASRSNSFSEHSFTNTLRRLSNPDGMKALFGAAPQSPTTPNGHTNNSGNDGGLGRKIKRTLLSELENEWFRELNFSKSITGGDESPTSEKSFFANDDDDDISRLDYLSDDEFIFLDQFSTENEKAAIREWFWRRWARSIYLFFRLIWRWAKFILILIAANLMAIYRGPDDILPDEM